MQSMVQRISGMTVPNMIIYDYNIAPYNLSNSRTPQVPENLITAFGVLNIKDMEYAHVVRNVLLDQTSAERLLLVEVSHSSKIKNQHVGAHVSDLLQCYNIEYVN